MDQTYHQALGSRAETKYYVSILCSKIMVLFWRQFLFFFFFLQVHLETTGEAAGINKEKKTEANLACSCCEQCDGFVFRRICSLVLQKALAPTDFFKQRLFLHFLQGLKWLLNWSAMFIIYHNSSLERKHMMSFRTKSSLLPDVTYMINILVWPCYNRTLCVQDNC